MYNQYSSLTLLVITLFVFMFLPGCTAVSNSVGVIPTPTPSPNPLAILTSALPNAQTGTLHRDLDGAGWHGSVHVVAFPVIPK